MVSGRTLEIKRLQNSLSTKKSELIAVYGRPNELHENLTIDILFAPN